MDKTKIRPETLRAFQGIVDRLRADTVSDRTTIRVDCDELALELETVAAESLAEGVNPIKPHRTPGLRNGAAPRWLARHRRTFVMDDCLNPWDPDFAPEPYVIETYGVRSEMVSPVFKNKDLVGIISVHYTKGPRQWSAEEVERVQAACECVSEILGNINSLRYPSRS